MDVQRAREIASSPRMVNVTHNGRQIYIQQVNEQSATARIYPLGQPDNEQEVPVMNLQEQ